MLTLSPSSTTAPAPSTRCRSSTARSARPTSRQIKGADGDGLLSYDPAFLNTASCRSAITYIDGDAGILRYRGYPIEQVAEQASFLETAYLLLEGELPTDGAARSSWTDDVRIHTYVHTNINEFLEGFRYDAHPMGMLLGAVGALSTFYPGREGHRRPREPLPPARAADREAADDRGVHLPPLPRPAVRAARATTSTTSATSST